MKKKVLHIFPAYKIGGGPICVYRLIEGIGGELKNYTVGNIKDKGFYNTFSQISDGAFDIDLLKISYRSIIELKGLIKKVKPDIVHAHGKGAALYAFIISILLFKPFKLLYTFHGFHKKWSGIKWPIYLVFEHIMSYFYECGIAVSESEKKYYIEKTKVNTDKVKIIHNGVSIYKSEPELELKETIKKYKINIVTLSRISHQKDLETMLMAFNEINNENIALHIIGGCLEADFSYRNSINVLYETLKYKSNIFFWGDVPNAGNILHVFDIYWSTAIFEGLPTAIIEAFLSKTLVVATNCRGNIDLVKDLDTGYLTKIKDVDSNVFVINSVLEMLETDLSNKIISKAYQYAQSYSIKNYVKNILNLYNTL